VMDDQACFVCLGPTFQRAVVAGGGVKCCRQQVILTWLPGGGQCRPCSSDLCAAAGKLRVLFCVLACRCCCCCCIEGGHVDGVPAGRRQRRLLPAAVSSRQQQQLLRWR